MLVWFLIFLLPLGHRDVNRVKWNPFGQVNHMISMVYPTGCSENAHTYHICHLGSPSKPWLYAAKFIVPHCTYAIVYTQHSAVIDWLHVTVPKVMWTPSLINKKMYVPRTWEAFCNEINSCAWLLALCSLAGLLFSHCCPTVLPRKRETTPANKRKRSDKREWDKTRVNIGVAYSRWKKLLWKNTLEMHIL